MSYTMNTRRLLQASIFFLGVTAVGLLTVRHADGGINGGGFSRGAIRAFGSIFVNDIEYSTASAQIVIDGKLASQQDLRVGQVVTVDGFVNADEVTGNAFTVSFESDLRGKVTGVDPTDSSFTLLAQKVRVNGATVFDSGLTPANLSGITANARLEVSGYRDSTGALVASRIDRTSSTQDRIVGTVANADAVAHRFRITGLTVNYASAQVDGSVVNGAQVEVKGTATSAITLTASKVEVLPSGLGAPANSASTFEGYVTRAPSGGRFAIGSQEIATTSATRYIDGTAADVTLNAKVEVDGRVNSAGVLVAEEIKIRFPDDARIHGVVTAKSTTGLKVNGIQVNVWKGTRIEDDSDARQSPFGLANVRIGDWIQADGSELTAPLTVRASRLERIRPDGRPFIEGLVSSVRPAEVRIVDQRVLTNSRTQYEDKAGRRLTASQFFAQAANREVKARGSFNGTVFTAEQLALKN